MTLRDYALVIFSLLVFCALIYQGAKRGRLSVPGFTIDRTTNPPVYWLFMVLDGLVIAGLLYSLISSV